MSLTAAQQAVLKADILANTAVIVVLNPDTGAVDYTGPINGSPNSGAAANAIADWYNGLSSPDFWVWRTKVPQAEIVGEITVDGTVWSWTAYISRSQGERDGWREMFADTGTINPSLANVRQGLNDIFSGPSGAAQRTHLLAVGRRKASRVEKLFAAGTGSTASPAVMGFEEILDGEAVFAARNS